MCATALRIDFVLVLLALAWSFFLFLCSDGIFAVQVGSRITEGGIFRSMNNVVVLYRKFGSFRRPNLCSAVHFFSFLGRRSPHDGIAAAAAAAPIVVVVDSSIVRYYYQYK